MAQWFKKNGQWYVSSGGISTGGRGNNNRNISVYVSDKDVVTNVSINKADGRIYGEFRLSEAFSDAAFSADKVYGLAINNPYISFSDGETLQDIIYVAVLYNGNQGIKGYWGNISTQEPSQDSGTLHIDAGNLAIYELN